MRLVKADKILFNAKYVITADCSKKDRILLNMANGDIVTILLDTDKISRDKFVDYAKALLTKEE